MQHLRRSYDAIEIIGKIITAAISDAAKRLVLGENARRLLKL
jgi:hypothetical protein